MGFGGFLYDNEIDYLSESESLEQHELKCLAMELAVPLWHVGETDEYMGRNDIGGIKDFAKYLLKVHLNALKFGLNNRKKLRFILRKGTITFKGNLIVEVVGDYSKVDQSYEANFKGIIEDYIY